MTDGPMTTAADSFAPTPPSDGWRYFDRIYCITLAERPDRTQHARRQFEQVGLTHRVEFVAVPKHPTNSEQGIFESHQLCLRQGLEAAAQTILIFEDDILFAGYSPRKLDALVRFCREDPTWQALFLGCFISRSRPTRYPGVIRVRYRCTTHAYAVRRPFAEQLIGLPWRGVAYDDAIRALDHPHLYAASPSFAFQSDAPTANDARRGLDRMRRLLGGMHRLQKLNHLLHRHRRLIILAHLVAVALIVWAVWVWRSG